MDNTKIRALSAQFEGLLLARMLEPLAKGLGEMGEVALGSCTLSLAQHDPSGFGSVLAAFLEKDAVPNRKP